MLDAEIDAQWMARALQLAQRGEGAVEPNPMVGCVIARGSQRLGEGWHARFGGPHAEIAALQSTQDSVVGATAYVTLEPCCHFGKTPPCTGALIAAGVRRVVIAHADPFPAVNGGGVEQLRTAGISVDVGLLADQAASLLAPYLKRVCRGIPWVIAKWAMTLDGKLATRTGDSRWISNEVSRAEAHRLRGRVDAIIVGRGTVALDDPRLTARPPGPRVATRIVLDSRASLSSASQLVKTRDEGPVWVVATSAANEANRQRLEQAGCEVLIGPDGQRTGPAWWGWLLPELARRGMTNVMVEGGGQVLGTLLDGRWIDEVHVFVAPKLAGGSAAPTPLAGKGCKIMNDALTLASLELSYLEGDIYLRGRISTQRSGGMSVPVETGGSDLSVNGSTS